MGRKDHLPHKRQNCPGKQKKKTRKREGGKFRDTSHIAPLFAAQTPGTAGKKIRFVSSYEPINQVNHAKKQLSEPIRSIARTPAYHPRLVKVHARHEDRVGFLPDSEQVQRPRKKHADALPQSGGVREHRGARRSRQLVPVVVQQSGVHLHPGTSGRIQARSVGRCVREWIGARVCVGEWMAWTRKQNDSSPAKSEGNKSKPPRLQNLSSSRFIVREKLTG